MQAAETGGCSRISGGDEMKRKSLMTEIMVPMVVGIVVSMILISLLLTLFMRRSENRILLREVELNVNIINGEISSLLKSLENEAILIAGNRSVIDALKTGNRGEALDLLRDMVKRMHEATGYSVKIHIHTADLFSFVREWKPDKFGDYLGKFRHTLVYVKETHRPLAAIEVGRAGPVARGISPIFYDGKYIGSVEVISPLGSALSGAMKNLHILKILVLLNERYSKIASFVRNRVSVGRFKVINRSVSSEIIHALETTGALKRHFIELPDRFLIPMEIKDFKGNNIGYLVVVKDKRAVLSILDPLKRAMAFTIFIILFTAVVIVVAMYLVIRKIIRRIKRIKNKIGELARGEGDLTRRLKVEVNDEFGEITKEVNVLLDSVQAMIAEMHHTSSVLNSKSAEMDRAIERMHASFERANSNIQEISHALSDSAKAVDDVARSSENVNALAEDVIELNQQMVRNVESRVERMKENSKIAEEAVVQIDEVGSISKEIGQIVNVITDITDQTNLLALNAAIEAARAGEAGRGFAVVADEVRKLAERTQRATEEIKGMVARIRNTAGSAVEKTKQAARAILEESEVAVKDKEFISGVIDKTDMVMDEIRSTSAATEELSSTISEIDMEAKEVVSIVKESNELAESVEKIARELKEAANDIERLIGRFKV